MVARSAASRGGFGLDGHIGPTRTVRAALQCLLFAQNRQALLLEHRLTVGDTFQLRNIYMQAPTNSDHVTVKPLIGKRARLDTLGDRLRHLLHCDES